MDLFFTISGFTRVQLYVQFQHKTLWCLYRPILCHPGVELQVPLRIVIIFSRVTTSPKCRTKLAGLLHFFKEAKM
jgi:hypothetical protein